MDVALSPVPVQTPGAKIAVGTYAAWLTVGSGAPSGDQSPDASALQVYLRSGASSQVAAIYVSVDTGATWYVVPGVTTAALAILDDTTTAAILTTLGAQEAAKICVPSLTAAAESGNAIAVTIGLKDGMGVTLARAQRLKCQILDAAGLIGLVAEWTLAETGAGSEISTTARPTLIIETDASGAAVVTVTDVSGTFAGTVYLEVTPVSLAGASPEPGMPTQIALTFA